MYTPSDLETSEASFPTLTRHFAAAAISDSGSQTAVLNSDQGLCPLYSHTPKSSQGMPGLVGKSLVVSACLLAVADGFSSYGIARGATSSRLSLSCGASKASNRVVHGMDGLVMSGREGEGGLERRSFIGLAGLAAGVTLSAPSASNADMAPMGADVLDRCVKT